MSRIGDYIIADMIVNDMRDAKARRRKAKVARKEQRERDWDEFAHTSIPLGEGLLAALCFVSWMIYLIGQFLLVYGIV